MLKCPKCSKPFSAGIMYDLHIRGCNVGVGGVGGVIETLENENIKLKTQITLLQKKIRKNDIRSVSKLPKNDYMTCIASRVISPEQKNNSLNNMESVIKGILCGGGCEGGVLKFNNKTIIAVAILGNDNIILGYKWDYFKLKHAKAIVSYFLGVFKTHFFELYGMVNISQFNEEINRQFQYLFIENERELIKSVFDYLRGVGTF